MALRSFEYAGAVEPSLEAKGKTHVGNVGHERLKPLSERIVAESVAKIRSTAKENTQPRRGREAVPAHQPPQELPDAMVPVWEGDDYDRVAPGTYAATIVRVGKPDWLHRYKRWNVTVSYELDSGEQVPGYYSLGRTQPGPGCPAGSSTGISSKLRWEAWSLDPCPRRRC